MLMNSCVAAYGEMSAVDLTRANDRSGRAKSCADQFESVAGQPYIAVVVGGSPSTHIVQALDLAQIALFRLPQFLQTAPDGAVIDSTVLGRRRRGRA